MELVEKSPHPGLHYPIVWDFLHLWLSPMKILWDVNKLFWSIFTTIFS